MNGILEVTAKSCSNTESVTVTIQDALDRSGEAAFQESLSKMKELWKQELSEVEDLELFDLMDDDDFEDEDMDVSLSALQAEAKDLLKQYQEYVKHHPHESSKQVNEMVHLLEAAIKPDHTDTLEEAIDMAMDLLIDLEV